MNAETGTGLMPRATVEGIVALRNRSLSAFSEAHAALSLSGAAVVDANNLLKQCSPTRENRYSAQIDREKTHFHYATQTTPPERADYMETARRIVDTEVWARIVEMTELYQLMDKTARDEFAQALMKEPPEVTVDNVYATLETKLGQAGMMFRRGIATCFSTLDRRFRSHDGWKVGSRIILTHAFSEYGSWNYSSDHEASFRDIERVFRQLDGKPALAFCEIIQKLEEARGRRYARHQLVIETDYFRVRTFYNGNAHIWFLRDDLLKKVNRLIGEYYGAPIPEEREAKDDGGLNVPKFTPAKYDGFFPTPDAAADILMRDVYVQQRTDEPPLDILEPSAGTGQLARRCVLRRKDVREWERDKYRYDNRVDCVEIDPGRAADLKAAGIYRRVLRADFLSLSPSTTGLYDIVVMNPPFDRERDIDHVMHALKFLRPGGQLNAIMSAGTEFRETRKSIAFRALMDEMRAEWRDLPPGSFAESGTYCNALILRVRKYDRPK